MKNLILLVLVFAFQSAFADLSDVTVKASELKEKLQKEIDEKGGIWQSVQDRLQRASVGIPISFINTTIGDATHIGVKGKPKVEPSFYEGFTARNELYDIGVGFGLEKVSNLVKKIAPVFIDGSFQIGFIRQFQNWNDAIDFFGHKPYGPSHLPFNSKAAVEKLQIGDVFSLKAELGFGIKFARWNPTFNSNVINVEAYANWIQSGSFIMNVLRMDNNKVRVKMFALKKKGPEGLLKAEITPNIHSFGWDTLNNRAEGLLSINLSTWNKSGAGDIWKGLPDMQDGLLMADYTFDLNNAEARKAYDTLFGKFYVYKDGKLNFTLMRDAGVAIDPREQNLNESKKFLEKNIVEVEAIVKEDLALNVPKDKKRIHKEVSIENLSLNNILRHDYGFSYIYQSKSSSTYSKNKVAFTDDKGTHFNLDHHLSESTEQEKQWFNLYRKTVIKSIDVLCKTNPEHSECDFQGLGVHYSRTDTDYTADEHAKLIYFLQHNVSPSIYKKIKWNNWEQLANRKNAYVNMQILFKRKALDIAQSNSSQSPLSIKERLINFINSKKQSYLFKLLPSVISAPAGESDNWLEQEQEKTAFAASLEKDIDLIASRLTIVFDENQNSLSRVKAFMDLRGNELFHNIGAGFITSFLPADNMDNLLYVRLRANSPSESKKLQWHFGQNEKVSFYKSAVQMQAQMNNRSIDPSLNDDLGDEDDDQKSDN